jgi:hypothetical protein
MLASSTLESPATVVLTAGNALNPAYALTSRQSEDNMAAHVARCVLERGGRAHDTMQLTVFTIPNIGRSVGNLGQGHSDGFERGDLVVLIQRHPGPGTWRTGRVSGRAMAS